MNMSQRCRQVILGCITLSAFSCKSLLGGEFSLEHILVLHMIHIEANSQRFIRCYLSSKPFDFIAYTLYYMVPSQNFQK
jgi:hypothetical protein